MEYLAAIGESLNNATYVTLIEQPLPNRNYMHTQWRILSIKNAHSHLHNRRYILASLLRESLGCTMYLTTELLKTDNQHVDSARRVHLGSPWWISVAFSWNCSILLQLIWPRDVVPVTVSAPTCLMLATRMWVRWISAPIRASANAERRISWNCQVSIR